MHKCQWPWPWLTTIKLLAYLATSQALVQLEASIDSSQALTTSRLLLTGSVHTLRLLVVGAGGLSHGEFGSAFL